MSGLKPLTEQTGEELLEQFRNLLGRVIFDASLQGKLSNVEKEILKRMSLDLPGDEEIEKPFPTEAVQAECDVIRKEIMLEIEAEGYTEENLTEHVFEKMFLDRAAVARLRLKWLRSRIGGGR